MSVVGVPTVRVAGVKVELMPNPPRDRWRTLDRLRARNASGVELQAWVASCAVNPLSVVGIDATLAGWVIAAEEVEDLCR